MRYLFALVLLFLSVLGATAQTKVEQLLCENTSNPIGMGVEKPRFTWLITSTQGSTMQTAYELVIREGKKTVWSTGKVNSDQSVLVEYAGTPLVSNTKYNWQVRVWDNHGGVSAWSALSNFHTALFQESDWKAKWISIGFEEEATTRPVQYFRKSFAVKKKIAQATAFITSQGMYEAYLNGSRVGDAYLTPGWTSYKTRLQYCYKGINYKRKSYIKIIYN